MFDRPDVLSTEDDTMGVTCLTFVKCMDNKRVAAEKYFSFSLGTFISSCLFFPSRYKNRVPDLFIYF